MERQWLILLLWTSLLSFCRGSLQFGCDSGYFDVNGYVATVPEDLKKLTNVTGTGNWFRCIAACFTQQSCLSAVYDNSSDLCYIADAALNCLTNESAKSARYQCAVLKTICSDIENCSLSRVCSSLVLSRRAYTGCSDARNKGNTISGPYYVDPDGLGSFQVWCDFIGDESWTVFQRRLDGSIDFYRGWADYKNGFGDVTKEYWLGLERVYRLTTLSTPKLNIFLDDFHGNSRHANYSSMSLTNETNLYKLTLGDYSGNAGDSMGQATNQSSSGMLFSTHDRDNDVHPKANFSCAQSFQGAWWYRSCVAANLNGKYLRGNHTEQAIGIEWVKWTGLYYSLRTSIMRILV